MIRPAHRGHVHIPSRATNGLYLGAVRNSKIHRKPDDLTADLTLQRTLIEHSVHVSMALTKISESAPWKDKAEVDMNLPIFTASPAGNQANKAIEFQNCSHRLSACRSL